MKYNIDVNVEGSELILKNKAGDYVIIPKKYRTEVQNMIKESCHGCIDSLVETLPIASQYAQDGSVYPPNKKVKVNQNNQIKEYDISSKEYRDLYDSGKLMNYDKNTDTYIAKPLEEVIITAEAPQWLKYKREYEKNNPKSDYINQYLNPFARSLGNTETNYPKRLDDEYEQKSLDYVSEQLVKNKPQGKLSRAEWLNQMSDKEEELIKRNPKYQSSLWADTKRGLTSLVEQNPLQTFQNILNSSDYTNREKQEMLKDYADHPVMSKLGDAAKILNPLTVPSKMVQSTYKKDYSFKDALSGKQNNAGIVEDIVTDPLNLVGLGIWGKLSKANKFKNLDEAYNAIKTLDKASLEKQLGNTISDKDWEYLYRVQEKGFDIERPTLKAIEERVAKGEGKWYDKNILNNPELRSNVESRDKYYGRWFEKDPKRLDYYLADKGEDVEILRTKVPKEILEQYRIDKFDPEIAKKWSLSHETEYIIPKDIIQKAEKFDKKDWSKLIDEHNKVIDATKAGSKVLNKADDVVKNSPELNNIVDNQLPELPHEIILDNNTINLERLNPKNKKQMLSFDDVDLGSDLTLRNNPSRVADQNTILGKNRSIKSVLNKKTNESVDLKTWQDGDGKIYYYMSANMPSSKLKAGKAYLELEKHIPKGESILENSSLSYDSFLNILKQTKNPKFETFVKGKVPMNDNAKNNLLKIKGDSYLGSNYFNSEELANAANKELIELTNKYSLPNPTVVPVTSSSGKIKAYEIQLPNIGLKKLYTILGLTSAGTYLQSQQNKSEQ